MKHKRLIAIIVAAVLLVTIAPNLTFSDDSDEQNLQNQIIEEVTEPGQGTEGDGLTEESSSQDPSGETPGGITEDPSGETNQGSTEEPAEDPAEDPTEDPADEPSETNETSSSSEEEEKDNTELIDTTITAQASDGAIVTIKGKLPKDAQAVIEPAAVGTDELNAYIGEEKASAIRKAAAYDIKIMVNDVEWQPKEEVTVSVENPNLQKMDTEVNQKTETPVSEEVTSVAALHIKDDGQKEAVEAVVSETESKSTDTTIEFPATGFSTYLFYTFTVDYYYGETEYHQAGKSSMYLADLLNELGTNRSVDEVASVTFTNEALVQPIGITAEEKQAYEAAKAISAQAASEVLTQIKERKNTAGEVAGPADWLLCSLEPFTSYETLMISLKDGSVLEIQVSDDLVHLYDYSEKPEVVSADFYNLMKQNLSWQGDTSVKNYASNAPDGYDYVAYREDAFEYPYGSGKMYDIYVASPMANFVSNADGGGPSRHMCCLACGNVYAFWIEDGNGNKLILDDVCVGSCGSCTIHYWQYDLGRGNAVFTNDPKNLAFYAADGSIKEYPDDEYATNFVYPGGIAVHKVGQFEGVLSNNDGYYYARQNTREMDEVSIFQLHGSYSDIGVKKMVADPLDATKVHSGTISAYWCDEDGKEIAWPEGAEIAEIDPETYEKKTIYTQKVSIPFSQSEADGVKLLMLIRPSLKLLTSGYFKIEEDKSTTDIPLSISPSTRAHYYKVEMRTQYPTVTYIGTEAPALSE